MLTFDSTRMLQEIQPNGGQVDRYRAPRAIAPAPASDPTRCRKKINFKTNPYTGPQAVSIARRNARERNRVKQVNDGFAALRRHLPASVVAALSHGARRGAGKKLSKVDTLRMVVEYIRYLQRLLDDGADSENVRCASPASEEQFEYAGSPCASPAPSETSSGVSSGYSVQCGGGGAALERYDTPHAHSNPHPHAHPHPHALSPMEEDELLDVISWWQQK